jgi:hypothetical protein
LGLVVFGLIVVLITAAFMRRVHGRQRLIQLFFFFLSAGDGAVSYLLPVWLAAATLSSMNTAPACLGQWCPLAGFSAAGVEAYFGMRGQFIWLELDPGLSARLYGHYGRVFSIFLGMFLLSNCILTSRRSACQTRAGRGCTMVGDKTGKWGYKVRRRKFSRCLISERRRTYVGSLTIPTGARFRSARLIIWACWDRNDAQLSADWKRESDTWAAGQVVARDDARLGMARNASVIWKRMPGIGSC